MADSINERKKVILFIALMIIGLVITLLVNNDYGIWIQGIWIQGMSVGICFSLWIDWSSKNKLTKG